MKQGLVYTHNFHLVPGKAGWKQSGHVWKQGDYSHRKASNVGSCHEIILSSPRSLSTFSYSMASAWWSSYSHSTISQLPDGSSQFPH